MPKLSPQKIAAGVFNGPQIRELIRDPDFIHSMNPKEAAVWKSFVRVVKDFLGNTRAQNYERLVHRMLDVSRAQGCRMSIKVYYLHSHLDWFPENLGHMSDEQGERFHLDMATIEERYRGRWDVRMMAGYCWSLTRDHPNALHRRRSHTAAFRTHAGASVSTSGH